MLLPALVWLWNPFIIPIQEKQEYQTQAFKNDKSEKIIRETFDGNKGHMLINFYTAPVTQFMLDFLLYVVMLVIYTYVCLIPFENNLDLSEWVLLFWFTAMVIVEIKQMFEFTPREYIKSFWNVNDIVIIVLYFWSFVFRMISTEKSRYEFDSKTILGMNAMPVYLRLVRFYAVSKNLGPKIGLLNFQIICE